MILLFQYFRCLPAKKFQNQLEENFKEKFQLNSPWCTEYRLIFDELNDWMDCAIKLPPYKKLPYWIPLPIDINYRAHATPPDPTWIWKWKVGYKLGLGQAENQSVLNFSETNRFVDQFKIKIQGNSLFQIVTKFLNCFWDQSFSFQNGNFTFSWSCICLVFLDKALENVQCVIVPFKRFQQHCFVF